MQPINVSSYCTLSDKNKMIKALISNGVTSSSIPSIPAPFFITPVPGAADTTDEVATGGPIGTLPACVGGSPGARLDPVAGSWGVLMGRERNLGEGSKSLDNIKRASFLSLGRLWEDYLMGSLTSLTLALAKYLIFLSHMINYRASRDVVISNIAIAT